MVLVFMVLRRELEKNYWLNNVVLQKFGKQCFRKEMDYYVFNVMCINVIIMPREIKHYFFLLMRYFFIVVFFDGLLNKIMQFF